MSIKQRVLDRIYIINEDRKESTKIVSAFMNKTSAKGKRTHTDGTGLYLHGHKIAWHGEGGAIHATLAGWGTTTTRDRLNTLTRHVHGRAMFSQKGGVQHYDGKPIGAHDHVTIRQSLRENVEPINELSKKTLNSYIRKARDSKMVSWELNDIKTLKKRNKGIGRAFYRLGNPKYTKEDFR